jgi:hypothetical protein
MITVQVNEYHIEQGAPSKRHNCPVSLAIINVLQPQYFPSVSGESIGVFYRCDICAQAVTVWRAEAPDAVAEFVDKFDDEGTAEPFEFDLDVPAEFLRTDLTASK